jgi:hypothetical protein
LSLRALRKVAHALAEKKEKASFFEIKKEAFRKKLTLDL